MISWIIHSCDNATQATQANQDIFKELICQWQFAESDEQDVTQVQLRIEYELTSSMAFMLTPFESRLSSLLQQKTLHRIFHSRCEHLATSRDT